jgi:hypothetical protein
MIFSYPNFFLFCFKISVLVNLQQIIVIKYLTWNTARQERVTRVQLKSKHLPFELSTVELSNGLASSTVFAAAQSHSRAFYCSGIPMRPTDYCSSDGAL